jgi:hypothetical protein
MDAKDRAVWEDAEGSLTVEGGVAIGKAVHLRTTQLERDILLDYQLGAAAGGVRVIVAERYARKTMRNPRSFTFYESPIYGLCDIARELELTAPYRRSLKFARQILVFKAFLASSNASDNFSVYSAAIGAGNTDDGVLPVAKPDPRVDTGNQEPLAPPAGEAPQGGVEADVELQLDLPGQGRLLLCDSRVGVREVHG